MSSRVPSTEYREARHGSADGSARIGRASRETIILGNPVVEFNRKCREMRTLIDRRHASAIPSTTLTKLGSLQAGLNERDYVSRNPCLN